VPTEIPTGTPAAQDTPTPAATPTVGTECTSGIDACGVCGGTTTDVHNCPVVPSDCNLVAPTKEMKNIVSKIKKARNSIRSRFLADVKRSKGIGACKSITKTSIDKIKAQLDEINTRVDANILRSVLVCGEDCLTVSFANEVGEIRKMLNKVSKAAQSFAKKVVQCAPNSSANDAGGNAPRSDSALDQIVRDTKNIVTRCKICKH